jgi:hypothetical protein
MSRAGVLLVLLIAGAGVTAHAAYCQSSTTNESTRTDVASGQRGPAARPLAPAANSLTVLSSVRLQSAPIVEPAPLAPVLPQARNRRGVPFMVAGGVLFLAGAIAGGDGGAILMIGGAGVGAYGAFVYFGGN